MPVPVHALTSKCVSTCPICAEPLVRSGRRRRAGRRARATRAERMGRVVQARLPAQEPRCRTHVSPQCSARHSSANSVIGATHCNSRSASSTIAVVGAISNGSNAPTCSSQRRAIGGGASAASECPSGPRHAKRVGPPSLPTAWPLLRAESALGIASVRRRRRASGISPLAEEYHSTLAPKVAFQL